MFLHLFSLFLRFVIIVLNSWLNLVNIFTSPIQGPMVCYADFNLGWMLRLSFLDTFFLIIPFGNSLVPAIAVEIGLFTFQRNQHCLVALESFHWDALIFKASDVYRSPGSLDLLYRLLLALILFSFLHFAHSIPTFPLSSSVPTSKHTLFQCSFTL